MTKEGMIKLARARIEQKSKERHFSDETVLNMKRAYEIKCECYESKIKELETQIEKMKWHYLVENPKDLPKKEGTYWICVRDGRYKEDGSWKWTSKPLCKTAVWLDGVFGYAGGPPVIGWCELPKWEIKENEGE